MAVFDPFKPLENVKLKFKEEYVNQITEWFDENSQAILVINNADPVHAVTIEQLQEFLASKRFHRRSFKYPNYGEIMKEAELLKAGVTRVLTRDQVLYLLDKFNTEANIKHELKMAFKVFDTENRNFLVVDQLRAIVTSFDNPFSEAEVRELLRDANVHGDGNVFYNDFVDSLFDLAPELETMKADYLYEDPDEDPSVPPLPEPPPPPPPPPTPMVEDAPAPEKPPAKGKGKDKGKDKGKGKKK